MWRNSGTGSVNHLVGEVFDFEAGVKTQHVPYKGRGSQRCEPFLFAARFELGSAHQSSTACKETIGEVR